LVKFQTTCGEEECGGFGVKVSEVRRSGGAGIGAGVRRYGSRM